MSQPVMHDEKAEVIDLNADVAVAAEPEAGRESSTSVLSEALDSRKEGIADTTLGDLTPDQPIKDARTASSILALLRDDLGTSEILNERAVRKDGFAVVVYPSKKPDQYVEYQETVVRKILEEYEFHDEISYLVRFADGQEEQVSSAATSILLNLLSSIYLLLLPSPTRILEPARLILMTSSLYLLCYCGNCTKLHLTLCSSLPITEVQSLDCAQYLSQLAFVR